MARNRRDTNLHDERVKASVNSHAVRNTKSPFWRIRWLWRRTDSS